MAEIQILKHTVSNSPKIQYTLYGSLVSRTDTTATIKFRVVSKITSSNGRFGYPIEATISNEHDSVNGYKTIQLKKSNFWYSGTTYEKETTITFTGLNSLIVSFPISFKAVTKNQGAGHMSSAVSNSFYIGDTKDSTAASNSSTISINDNNIYSNTFELIAQPILGTGCPIQLNKPFGYKSLIKLSLNNEEVYTWNNLFKTIEYLDFNFDNNSSVLDSINNLFKTFNNSLSIPGKLTCYTIDPETEAPFASDNKNFKSVSEDIQLTLSENVARPNPPILQLNKDDTSHFDKNTIDLRIDMPGKIDDFKYGAAHGQLIEGELKKWDITTTHPDYIEWSFDTDQNKLTVSRTNDKFLENDLYIIIRTVDSRGFKSEAVKCLCFTGQTGILVHEDGKWQGASF